MTPLTIGGMRLRVSALFLLLLLALAWAERLTQGLTVFGIVLLHELGHIAAARGYGIEVKEVELLPFGGVARLEGLIETDPRIEAGIALAGPLTNVFLIAVGMLLLYFDVFAESWSRFFVVMNGAIIAVNLIPALPLDGGRLYRAYRSRKIGYRKATNEAIRLGRWLAVCLLGAGLVGIYLGVVNITLPLLALFIFVAGTKEQQTTAYVFMAYLARKQAELQKYGCMETEPLAARGDATVKDVLELFIPQKYHLIWIVDANGRPTGIVAEGDVLDTLFDKGPDTKLHEVRQQRIIDRK